MVLNPGELTEENCGCRWRYTMLYENDWQFLCPGHQWYMDLGWRDGIKVSYEGTTAYISEKPFEGTDLHYGTNKHTDLPVALWWDQDVKQWRRQQ